jgi:hypothetical protein
MTSAVLSHHRRRKWGGGSVCRLSLPACKPFTPSFAAGTAYTYG